MLVSVCKVGKEGVALKNIKPCPRCTVPCREQVTSVVPVGRYSAGISVVLVGRHSLGRCDVGTVLVDTM